MRISLTPEQEAWFKLHFSVSDAASLEDAARALIDERIAEWEEDDLAWAKPMVDEGLAAIERGETLSLDEHKARIASRLAELKR